MCRDVRWRVREGEKVAKRVGRWGAKLCRRRRGGWLVGWGKGTEGRGEGGLPGEADGGNGGRGGG